MIIRDLRKRTIYEAVNEHDAEIQQNKETNETLVTEVSSVTNNVSSLNNSISSINNSINNINDNINTMTSDIDELKRREDEKGTNVTYFENGIIEEKTYDKIPIYRRQLDTYSENPIDNSEKKISELIVDCKGYYDDNIATFVYDKKAVDDKFSALSGGVVLYEGIDEKENFTIDIIDNKMVYKGNIIKKFRIEAADGPSNIPNNDNNMSLLFNEMNIMEVNFTNLIFDVIECDNDLWLTIYNSDYFRFFDYPISYMSAVIGETINKIQIISGGRFKGAHIYTVVEGTYEQ